MPLKRIGDIPKPCNDPDHGPPTHMVLKPGIYEHTCPSCGKVTRFAVSDKIC